MSSRERRAGLSARTVQIGLGGIWLLDGLLQLQPHMFGQAFGSQVLAPGAAGQPGFVAWPVEEMARLVSVHPAADNAVFAAVQVLIGIGLFRRATVRAALSLSFVWAAGVWCFGEGCGMLFTGTSSPLTGAPGAVLLYALVGVVAWPRREAAFAVASDGVASHGAPEPAPAAVPEAAAAEGLLGERGARIAWAVTWLGMAALWLFPANIDAGSVSAAIMSAAGSSPSWLAHFQAWVAGDLAGDGTTVAVGLAVLSAVVAVGPLVARRPSVFLVLGAALSLDFWVVGQSFGGLTTGLATDPNAGPLFVLFALALFPARAAATTAATEGIAAADWSGYPYPVADAVLPAG